MFDSLVGYPAAGPLPRCVLEQLSWILGLRVELPEETRGTVSQICSCKPRLQVLSEGLDWHGSSNCQCVGWPGQRAFESLLTQCCRLPGSAYMRRDQNVATQQREQSVGRRRAK